MTGPKPVELAAIWAQDSQGVIGSGTGMLWRVPADLRFFKAQTSGCPVIMGRRSWEALGGALPDRTNIVITTDPNYHAPNALVAPDWSEALRLAREAAAEKDSPTIWVTGGARVYAETLPLMDRLVVTHLDLTADSAAAARAPQLDPETWAPDPDRSDTQWRERSGDARWKVITYLPKIETSCL